MEKTWENNSSPLDRPICCAHRGRCRRCRRRKNFTLLPRPSRLGSGDDDSDDEQQNSLTNPAANVMTKHATVRRTSTEYRHLWFLLRQAIMAILAEQRFLIALAHSLVQASLVKQQLSLVGSFWSIVLHFATSCGQMQLDRGGHQLREGGHFRPRVVVLVRVQ